MKSILTFLILVGSFPVFAGHGPVYEEGQVTIPDLLPTMYYVADEEKTSCEGTYRGINYDGSEVSEVLDPSGHVIATVCTRFLKVLGMEGTGVLKDRGRGRELVNWAGNWRFKVMKKCIYGLGVRGLCLLPYHTIAADLQAHPVGTIIYIPRAKGLVLPGGKIHNGLFVVRDTGGAFRGIGMKRVDLFTGFDRDNDNPFSRAGFHHRRDEKAFRLTGKAKARALEFFQSEFPVLFNEREPIGDPTQQNHR